MIRGDNPLAAGLADVWLELHKTLTVLADPARARRVAIGVKPGDTTEFGEPESSGQVSANKPDNPDEPEAAAS